MLYAVIRKAPWNRRGAERNSVPVRRFYGLEDFLTWTHISLSGTRR